MSPPTRGYIYGLIGVVIFGLTLPFTRIAVAEIDPLFVAIGRTVIAAAAAVLIVLLTRQPWPDRRDLPSLAITAAGVVLGFPILSAIAMQSAPAAHGGVILAVLPLATAIMGTVFAGEHPASEFWVWSILGSAAVAAFALWDGGGGFRLADILLALAVIAAAIGYATGGNLSRRLGGWQVICWSLIVALPVTLPAVLLLLPQINWSASPPAWYGFLYLSLMSQLLGFFAWNKGLATGGVAKVGQTQLLQPFVTIAAAVAFLGETIRPHVIVFACIVAACVWFGRNARVRRLARDVNAAP